MGMLHFFGGTTVERGVGSDVIEVGYSVGAFLAS